MKPTPTPPAVAPNPQPAAAKPAAAAAVKGVKVVRGRARLAGARTCPIRPFNVRVTGRQIRRVTFFVDGRRLGSVTRERARIERRDRGEAPCGVREKVVPEAARVAEGAVQIDGDRFHRDARAATTTPMTTPAVSMSQSRGDPWRPRTNAWWSSSVTA